jgi:hypothetical protein
MGIHELFHRLEVNNACVQPRKKRANKKETGRVASESWKTSNTASASAQDIHVVICPRIESNGIKIERR